MTTRNNEHWRELLEELPESIQPRHELWPGLEARLGEKPRSARPTRRWPYAAAAAVFIAAGALSLVFVRQPAPPDNAAIAARHAGPATSLAELLPNADAIQPATRIVLARNLQIVQSAMTDIRRALRKDPGNSSLHELLYEIHRDRNTLLVASEEAQLHPNMKEAL
jgi:hypothetical protein